MRKRYSFCDLSLTFLTRGAAVVTDNKVPGHAANESREPLRLSNISLPNLFEDGAEDILIDVLSERRVANFPADDNHYATAIPLDQFGFRLPVAGSDAAH